jgi:hypothetical protein
VKPLLSESSPLGCWTVTVLAPAVRAGVTPVIVVLLTTEKLVTAAPPMVAPVAPVKLVPEMVIAVPPAVGPEFGVTLVTLGIGGGT